MAVMRSRRRKALSSCSERRRQCRKRTQRKVINRYKQFIELDQEPSVSPLDVKSFF